MRIAIAEVGQETSSFSPVSTTLETFRQFGLYKGQEILARRTSGRGVLSGFFATAHRRGIDIEPVPIVSGWAGASGPLSAETLQYFEDAIVTGLQSAPDLDGFFFSLHGAAAAENDPDVEGRLLAVARSVLGPSIPIVSPLDHHANVTCRMLANLTGLVGHRTQPHDPYDTGVQAAELFFDILDGRVRPTMAAHKIPLYTHQEQYLTSTGPMQRWFQHARRLETKPRVLSISPFPIQCWLDVPEGGWTTVVITDNEPELARQLSAELAAMAWEMRDEFWVQTSVSPRTAVQRALEESHGLTILSDTGDSVFGGATGDSTVILRELLTQQLTGMALLPVVDRQVATAATEAGAGETITHMVGGKLDPAFGQPVEVTAEVVALAEGPIQADVIGRNSFDMGKTALLRIGQIHCVVSEYVGIGGNHPIVYRRMGIEPAHAKIVVLKTASNFQYYADITQRIIRVDTPGPTMSRLQELPWQHIPHPTYPFDPVPAWSPEAGAM